MKRLIILGFIIITIFTGCSGKKNDPVDIGQFEGTFAYEKRVLLDMIDILKRYNARVLQASTTEEITKANEEFCDKLEILNPEITFVAKKHPDWEKKPPGELKTIIQEYINANREFGTMSFDIVTNKVESHPEDEDLLRSYERLKYITTPEGQDKQDTWEEELNENKDNLLW